MFPGGPSSQGLSSPHRVSFANDVMVLGDAPPLVNSPDIVLHEPLRPEISEEDDMDTGGAATDTSNPIIPPPLRFQQFSWPRGTGKWTVRGVEYSV